MPRYTSAYSSFVSRLDEVYLLHRIASAKEKADPVKLRKEINVFSRAAIVLLCAHLEAYIKELGEVVLNNITLRSVPRTKLRDRFYYHISRDILDEVRDTSDPEKLAAKLFKFLDSDFSYWSHTGPFPQALPVDRFNKGFSNPSFEKIRAYFNRFGYSDYQGDLARLLKAKYTATINMVDHLVDTRNKIAHGDITAVKPPADVMDMILIIRAYSGATDAVFGSWCKANLCSIR
jgi:hypothetical protein